MTQDLLARLAECVVAQFDYVAELRRRLHRIPEPGFCEKRTAELVAAELDKLDLAVRTGIAETGIIADLDTQRSGGYVAVRADMDGLPLNESTGVDYCSENAGYSHSCGHDGHAAAVIGVARVLSELRDNLTGKVRFIFQPAEEICRGAAAMIENNAFGPDPPAAILGLHAWPGLGTDTVACKKGTMMASCDVLRIEIEGKGGHGARPEQARNPLTGMARVVTELGKLDSERRIVSICTAKVGQQANIIADKGILSGTVRALTPQIRKETLREITSIVEHVCTSVGLVGTVHFDAMSPPVITDERLHALFREVGTDLLGAEKVIELESASMGSEDFGRYLQHVPGLLFRVGMGENSPGLHQTDFDFKDDALRTAILVLCGMAIRICSEEQEK